jgi:hypothetical protein
MVQLEQVQVHVLALEQAQWQLHAHVLPLVWIQGQMPLQAKMEHCYLAVTI